MDAVNVARLWIGRHWRAAAITALALYLLGPQPTVAWVDPVPSVAPTYECDPGFTPRPAPGSLLARATPGVECYSPTRSLILSNARMAQPGSSGRAGDRRLGLDLAGIRVRVFAFDFLEQDYLGFGWNVNPPR